MSKKLTIGFFGDSFCSDAYSFKFLWKNPTKVYTYTTMLAKHLNAKIVNLGVGGSSIADVMLRQFDPFVKLDRVPDVCVFTWTHPGRLFHKSIRNLNCGSVTASKSENPVWIAAKMYYEHLYDDTLAELEYVSLLEHFDNHVLSKLPITTKIVHLWSFGKPKEWSTKGYDPNNVEYYYNWKHGIEIRPALACISIAGSTYEEFVSLKAPNHLGTQEKNNLVFKRIVSALEQAVLE
jgi:hypothetical protein